MESKTAFYAFLFFGTLLCVMNDIEKGEKGCILSKHH
jgi:hypothetical protein